MFIVETVAAVLSAAKGVAISHGVTTTIPVVGRVGPTVRGEKGIIATKTGVSQCAASAKV